MLHERDAAWPKARLTKSPAWQYFRQQRNKCLTAIQMPNLHFMSLHSSKVLESSQIINKQF